MLIGNSISRMVFKSTIFNGEVEMDNITGICNRCIPNLGQLNKMTLTLIRDKDSDGDKALSDEELNVPEDVFTKIDANSDGNADRVELNAYYPISRIDILTLHLIKDKDTDGDKVLSAEELNAPEDVFTKIDANGDGNADRVELNAYYPISRIDIPTVQLIKDKDTDGDKVLSSEELGVNEDILKEIDTNGDGNADREELNAAHPLAKFHSTMAYLAENKDAFKDSIDVIV